MGHHDQGRPRRFDVERLLMMEERRRPILPPETVLDEFLPSDDLVLADVGCGIGFFALPAGRRLVNGRVYAVDPEPDLLNLLRQRAEEDGLKNVETFRADASHIPLEDAAVDCVLMSFVFHDIEDQDEALAEVRRILRPGGGFYLLEWEKDSTEYGPPMDIRIASSELPGMLRKAGFTTERQTEGPGPFYRLMARRP